MPRSTRDPYPDGRASRLHFRARLAWAVAATVAAFGAVSLVGSGLSLTKLYGGTVAVAGTLTAVGCLLQWSATRTGTGRRGPRYVGPPPPTSPVPGPPTPTSPDSRPTDQPGPSPTRDLVPAEPVPAGHFVATPPPVRVRLELLSHPVEPPPAGEWDPILAERW